MNDDKERSERVSPGRGLITAVKFIFIAIPGGFLLVVGLLMLAGELLLSNPSKRDLVAYSCAAIVGFPLTMYGIDRWGQWRYTFVFISIPVSFFLWDLAHITIIDPKLDIIFTAIIPLLVFRIVKKSYEKGRPTSASAVARK